MTRDNSTSLLIALIVAVGGFYALLGWVAMDGTHDQPSLPAPKVSASKSNDNAITLVEVDQPEPASPPPVENTQRAPETPSSPAPPPAPSTALASAAPTKDNSMSRSDHAVPPKAPEAHKEKADPPVIASLNDGNGPSIRFANAAALQRRAARGDILIVVDDGTIFRGLKGLQVLGSVLPTVWMNERISEGRVALAEDPASFGLSSQRRVLLVLAPGLLAEVNDVGAHHRGTVVINETDVIFEAGA